MRWLLWYFCLLAESYETINHYHVEQRTSPECFQQTIDRKELLSENTCNVRRIVACLCLPVTLVLRFSVIVLIAVTRPRVIDGPRFLCNSAYLEECCFFLSDWNVEVCQYTN